MLSKSIENSHSDPACRTGRFISESHYTGYQSL